MIKAIDTTYKGYKFRSRLEARFAVFMDALNIRWDYEIEGFNLPNTGKYLPDFFLPENGLCGSNSSPLWVEVKAIQPTKEEIHKLRELAVKSKITGAFFCGSPTIHIPNTFQSWLEGYYNNMSLPILQNFQYPTRTYEFISKFCEETYIEQLRIGAKAALSARFEFGESG